MGILENGERLDEQTFFYITKDRLLIRILIESDDTTILFYIFDGKNVVQFNYLAIYDHKLEFTTTRPIARTELKIEHVVQILEGWSTEEVLAYRKWVLSDELVVVIKSRTEPLRVTDSIPIFTLVHFGRIQEILLANSRVDKSVRKGNDMALKRLEGFLDEYSGNIQAAAMQITGLVLYP